MGIRVVLAPLCALVAVRGPRAAARRASLVEASFDVDPGRIAVTSGS